MKVFSVVGGCAGKTEVVRRLVAELTQRGLRVSTVKRVLDTVDLEKPGSGTWKHREAGAEDVILASTARIALVREAPTTDARGHRLPGGVPADLLPEAGTGAA